MREEKQFVLAWLLLCIPSAILGSITELFNPIHELGHIIFGLFLGCIPVKIGWSSVGLVGRLSASPFIGVGGCFAEIFGAAALWFWAFRATRKVKVGDWVRTLHEPVLFGMFLSGPPGLWINQEELYGAGVYLMAAWIILGCYVIPSSIRRFAWTIGAIRRLNAPRVVSVAT